MPITHDERAQRRAVILDEVRAGEDINVVAKRHGVSEAWVRDICREGHLPRSRTRPTAVRTLEVVAMIQRGEAMADIARELGVSRQYVLTVKQTMADLGVYTGAYQPGVASMPAAAALRLLGNLPGDAVVLVAPYAMRDGKPLELAKSQPDKVN